MRWSEVVDLYGDRRYACNEFGVSYTSLITVRSQTIQALSQCLSVLTDVNVA